MDNLRIILIIAGIAIIAAIYFWDRMQSRKKARRQTVSPATHHERNESGMVISAAQKDEDLSATIDELDGFFIDVDPDLDEDAPGEIFISRDPTVQPKRRPISESLAIPEQSDAFADEAARPAAASEPPLTVITLFVVAPEGKVFIGPDIQSALAALKFEFGEMSIFHHRGSGELVGKHPLFSLVNMYEPGYFVMDEMDTFTTRGLSVFAQLPMEHDPEIVFPYMLEMTRRLAKKLGANLLGPDRKPLDQAAVDNLNRQISNYVG
jgi:cell division protein ZipA